MKKRGTSLLVVMVLTLLGQPGQAAMEGMISYWRLDEPAGEVVCDSVGDNHGTIYGDPQRVAGIVGGAMKFDGVDDYVEVADDVSLDFGTGDFSIAVWVNFDTVPSVLGHALVVKRQQGPVYPGYSLFSILDGQLKGQLDFGWPPGPVHEHTTTSAPLTAGTWYHVVWAVDRARSESYFYVNGNAIDSPDTITVSGSTDNDDPLYIGAGPVTTTKILDGVIDEVAIYNRALSAEEIQHNYKNGFPSEPPVTYEGDTLLSTGGAAVADAYLAATLRGCGGGVLDIDGEEVTFVLTAEGVKTKMVSTATVAGIAATIEPLSPAIYDIEFTLANWVTASAILVVYNPEGGFATGGGWIVPVSDGLNTYPGVRANFGFSAKYKQDVPTGHLQFRYTNGFIDLKSDSVDLLVITGGRIAQFKGYATVNGESGHWYFVKAIDNGEPGTDDTFEIKVWAPGADPDVDECHRAGGTLHGGNIVVHKK